MSKEFIYKVTKYYETAELPDNCFGGQVKWVKDTSEPETTQNGHKRITTMRVVSIP